MKTQEQTILVIEDEKQMCGVIQPVLESKGFRVITARSVPQALDHMKNGAKIDVVWLDHYLFGKEDGLDFMAKIKQDGSAWKNLPVFVVSNTVSPEKIQIYLKLGVIKCYTKTDFRLYEIVTDIKRFLKRRKKLTKTGRMQESITVS
jgi:CheY-like chemotaxis protein